MQADKLFYMANQIAKNLAVQGEASAAAATAEHITQFWDPRMKQAAFEALQRGDEGLSKIANVALSMLADSSGHSDVS
jgi:formate dehydrogenase subunit delta